MDKRDRKFNEAVKYDLSYISLPNQIQNTELKKVAEQYASNMEQIHSLSMIPIIFAQLAERLERTHIKFLNNIRDSENHLDKTLERLEATNPQDNRLKKLRSMSQHMSQTAQKAIDVFNTQIGMTGQSQFGLGVADHLIERNLPNKRSNRKTETFGMDDLMRGLDAIFGAMIIGTWTAFEVLAEDVWKETVRLHPGDLLRWKTSGDQAQPKRQKTLNLKVDVDDFIKSNFKIEYDITEFLKEMHNFEFQTYDKIRAAYQTTFMQSFPSLDTDVDRALFDLAQTRNVIVHNAGIADRPFVERMVNIAAPLPQFVGIKKNERVPIDGEIVNMVVGNAIKSCVKLIIDVDSWISSKGLN